MFSFDTAFSMPERHLAAAVYDLPASVAISMKRALTEGKQQIEACRYDTGAAMCPLGAADAYAEARGGDRLEGASSDPGYGGRLLRFAVRFDLCAKQQG